MRFPIATQLELSQAHTAALVHAPSRSRWFRLRRTERFLGNRFWLHRLIGFRDCGEVISGGRVRHLMILRSESDVRVFCSFCIAFQIRIVEALVLTVGHVIIGFLLVRSWARLMLLRRDAPEPHLAPLRLSTPPTQVLLGVADHFEKQAFRRQVEALCSDCFPGDLLQKAASP